MAIIYGYRPRRCGVLLVAARASAAATNPDMSSEAARLPSFYYVLWCDLRDHLCWLSSRRCLIGWGDSIRAERFAKHTNLRSRSARPYLEIGSMIAPMPYTRRPAGPNTDGEDYVIRCEAHDVGRVYRRPLSEGHRYCWTIYISGHVPQVPAVPTSGLAVTLMRPARRSSEPVTRCGRKPDPEAAAVRGDSTAIVWVTSYDG
jgi:hypothetical protein